MLTVIKIGGSLFSDKLTPDAPDREAIDAYAGVVAQLHRQAPGRVILVSGGGSIGHDAVRRMDARKETDLLNLTGENFKLKWLWHEALKKHDVRSMPMQLASMVLFRGAVDFRLDASVLQTALNAHFLPVLTGDSLMDVAGRLSIVGSDIVPGIAHAVSTESVRIVMLTDVPGILERDDAGDERTVENVTQRSNLDDLLWVAPAGDTTGGMHGKVKALLEHAKRGAECVILHGEDCKAEPETLLAPIPDWPEHMAFTQVSWDPPGLGAGE